MSRYANELKLAPRTIVKSQMGLLMRELASESSPKNRSSLDISINKDLSTVYRPLPRKMLPNVHVNGRGFVWLMAGPNFLMGVKDQNYHPDDSLSDLQRLFHKTKKAKIIIGKAYKDIGVRQLKHTRRAKLVGGDRQHLIDANRIMVKRSVYMAFRSWLKTRVGILGASWCAAWDYIGVGGREPQAFKMKHVRDGSHRGAFIDGLGALGNASFTIINRASGSESKNSTSMIAKVLRHRTEAMKVDLKNILSGAYNRAGWSQKSKLN